ncbi:hypothetical protein [Mesoterricola silvestris]|uniref:Uncharacterized protein n=1 Tax=Mesoterricola silvestris TaxID=2927979 RepID=A0AA48GRK3_9BACT|nr:hypothetical protein [Mesoterricola silvestris]BDU74849.1 hypothetical protein METEAL_40230 [Mesoterricola silvestris]
MPSQETGQQPARLLGVAPIIWALVGLSILLLPMLIVATGYLPLDDALRHAAKAVDGRPWSQILVLREGIMGDPNAAWHGLLRSVHLATGCGPEALVVGSVVVLCSLVLAAPLACMRAPEAWIGAWALALVTEAPLARLMLGRPFLVNMACLVAIMALWSRPGPRSAWRSGGTLLLFTLAALMHGSWYLAAVIPLAFLLAGRIQDSATLAVLWATGSVLAGILTGHPVEFLLGELIHMVHALKGTSTPGILVPELRPSGGNGLLALTCLGAVAFSLLRDPKPERLLRDPLFVLAVLCWVFGLKFRRFWADWGLPCAMLWIAFEAEPYLLRLGQRAPLRRLQLAGGICLSFLLLGSADLNARWTASLRKTYVTADVPGIGPWLPAPGGIFYAPGMDFFFETFFRNPGAPWRYMVGYEPSMMPPHDLEVFRQTIASPSPADAIQPWIRSMRPEDRLALRGLPTVPPGIQTLEWFHVGGDLWIGRKPRR